MKSIILPESLSFQSTGLIRHNVGTLKLINVQPIRIAAEENAFYYVSKEYCSISLHEGFDHEGIIQPHYIDRVVACLDNDTDGEDGEDTTNYLVLVMCAEILNAWCGYLRMETRNNHMNRNNRLKMTPEQMASVKSCLSAPYGGSHGIYNTASDLVEYYFPIDKNGFVYECHMTFDKETGFVDSIRFCTKENM